MGERKHISFTIEESKSILVDWLTNQLVPILSWLKLALWLNVCRRTHYEEISLIHKIEDLLETAYFLMLKMLEDKVVGLCNEDSLAFLQVVPLKHDLVNVIGLCGEH